MSYHAVEDFMKFLYLYSVINLYTIL